MSAPAAAPLLQLEGGAVPGSSELGGAAALSSLLWHEQPALNAARALRRNPAELTGLVLLVPESVGCPGMLPNPADVPRNPHLSPDTPCASAHLPGI